MELSEYLRGIRTHWLTILVTTVVALALGLAISMLLPRSYSSTAVVFVSTTSAKSSSYENSQFTLQRVKSYPSLATSPGVLAPVISELQLKTSVAALADKVTALNPVGTVNIQVSAKASTAAGASVLANSVANHLVEEIKHVEASNAKSGNVVLPAVAVSAVEPESPTTPNLKINLALALVAGLAAGMFLALLRLRSHRTIFDAADVEAASGLKLIGQVGSSRIAARREKERPAGASSTKVLNPYLDTWTNILLDNNGERPSSVLMAPADEQSAHRSQSMRRGFSRFVADSGFKVCYIETEDILPPAFPEVPRQPGLTQVLHGEADIRTSIRTMKDSSLFVMPGGNSSADPLEPGKAVQSERFIAVGTPLSGPELIDELSSDYEIVMVQGSVTESAMSSRFLAPAVGAVVILAIYGKTSAVALRQATLELKAAGVKPAGVVLLHSAKKSLNDSGKLAVEAPWKVA